MALLQKILHDPFTSVDGRWISPDTVGDQRRTLRSGGKHVGNGTDNYVDTGIYPTTDTKIEMKMRFRTTGTEVTGCLQGTKKYGIGIYLGQWLFLWGEDSAFGGTPDTEWHIFRIENGKFYVDDVLTADLSSESVGEPIFTYYLLARHGNTNLYAEAEVAWAKIWKNGTDLTLEYHCDEGDGTTAYDVSGNENHGTIGGATASLHQTDIALRSWHNEVGYNLSGSTYIPREETSTNQALDPASQKDVLGSTLTYYGRAKYDGTLKSNCAALNGVDNEASSDAGNYAAVNDGDFYINLMWIEGAEGAASETILCNGGASGDNGRIRVTRFTDRRVGYQLVGTTGSTTQNSVHCIPSTNDLEEDDLIEVTLTRTSGTVVGQGWNHTKGTSYTSSLSDNTDATPATPSTATITISEYANRDYDLLYAAIGTDSENLVSEFVFGEGDGDTTYDRIGTNHITWSGALGSLWTKSEYQEPYNNRRGFDRWKNDATGADLFVPLQTNGTSIQTSGDTLSGYTWQAKVSTGSDKHHNGSDTEIHQPENCPRLYEVDQNEFATPIWYDAAGVPQAIVRGMLVENYLSADAWLNRLDSLEIQEDNIAALDQWNLSGVTDGNSDRGQLYGVYLHDSDSDYDTSIWLFDDPSGLPGSTPPFNSHLVAYFKTGVNNYTGTATLSEYNDSGISGAVEILTNGGTWAPDEEFTYQMRLETWADWQVGEEEIPAGGVFYGGLSLSLSLGA